MKLKSTLVALALGLIAMLGMNGAAFAYVGTPQTQGTAGGAQVTCYQEDTRTGGLYFPGAYFWYCGENEAAYGTQDFSALQSQVSESGLSTSAKYVMMAKPVHFFVFKNNTDYQTFCTGDVISPAGAKRLIPKADCIKASGFTQYDQGDTQTIGGFFQSIVPENYVDRPSGQSVDQNTQISGGAMVKFALLHEAGHDVDELMASDVTPGASLITDTALFDSLLADDWTAINNLDANNPGGIPNGCNLQYGSKLFVNQVDLNGDPICLPGGGVNTGAKNAYNNTLHNQAILQLAWPYLYQNNSKGQTELGVSLNAWWAGAVNAGPQLVPLSTGTQNEAGYLGQFVCTGTLWQSIAEYGTLPSSYPPNCAH